MRYILFLTFFGFFVILAPSTNASSNQSALRGIGELGQTFKDLIQGDRRDRDRYRYDDRRYRDRYDSDYNRDIYRGDRGAYPRNDYYRSDRRGYPNYRDYPPPSYPPPSYESLFPTPSYPPPSYESLFPSQPAPSTGMPYQGQNWTYQGRGPVPSAPPPSAFGWNPTQPYYGQGYSAPSSYGQYMQSQEQMYDPRTAMPNPYASLPPWGAQVGAPGYGPRSGPSGTPPPSEWKYDPMTGKPLSRNQQGERSTTSSWGSNQNQQQTSSSQDTNNWN